MAKRKAKLPVLPVIPPKGPATNLRPAGPHKDPRRATRAEATRAALDEQGT